jgi:2-amino-4-hydroxy-6-hydroxymethyldihydropteridine diphosphokinase
MDKKINLVYLGLGSNLGKKKRNLQDAINLISSEIGPVKECSDFYYSKPDGFSSKNEFVNLVVKVETTLAAFDLLDATEAIERSLGRTDKSCGVYKDRKIDIDILFFNDEKIATERLVIPHPLIFFRDYVRVPLLEIMN